MVAGGRWRWTPLLAPALLAAALAGCAGEEHGDLRAYVEEVRARSPGRIDPLPEIKVYETYTYAAQDLRDPFEKPTTREQEQEQQQAASSGISPEIGRVRELLEEYPLDSLRMVGTLERNEKVWAIIKANDGTVHRVVAGNFMGQNHGRILQISDTQIALREIIPDGQGGWRERDAALVLGE